MRRIAILIAGLLVGASPGAALASCQGVDVKDLVAHVPYFSEKMDRDTQRQSTSMVSFVHRDDARIRLDVRSQAAVQTPPVTKTEFIRDLRGALRDNFRTREGVGEPIVAVVPFDPLTWTVQSRVRSGDNVLSNGFMTIQKSSTCHVVATWSVVETPVLLSRIKEFTAALETLRYRVSEIAEPMAFLPEVNVPTGRKAILYGLFLPLAAAMLLAFGMRNILLLDPPGRKPRMVAGLGAGVAGVALLVQMPEFMEGYPDMRFLDVAGLLALISGTMGATAMGAGSRVGLGAFSLTFAGALALGVAGAFGWTPWPVLSIAVAAALVGCGCMGVWSWQNQPFRRVTMARERRVA